MRHGQTALNAGGLLQGRTDAPLTTLGRRQAAAVAAAIERTAPTGGTTAPLRVVTSPLGRALETAAAFGVDVEVDDRWIELDYGEWDGRPVESIAVEDWDRWRSDAAFAPPGGESLQALTRRVGAACEELAAAALDRHVVVVSHVSPMKAAVGWALGMGPDVFWRTFLDVASICRISVAPRGNALVAFNETGHLAALASGP